MKMVLLGFFLYVVINSGKKVFNAGQVIVSGVSNLKLAVIDHEKPISLK